MAKILNFTMAIVGITTLIKFAGIALPSTLLFSALGFNNPTSIVISTFIAALILALSTFAITGGGISVGFFSRTTPESVVRAGLAVSLIALTLPDLIGIYIYANNSIGGWVANLIALIVFPLVAAYVIAIVQWFGGQDI